MKFTTGHKALFICGRWVLNHHFSGTGTNFDDSYNNDRKAAKLLSGFLQRNTAARQFNISIALEQTLLGRSYSLQTDINRSLPAMMRLKKEALLIQIIKT
jgi:hypothetical protein